MKNCCSDRYWLMLLAGLCLGLGQAVAQSGPKTPGPAKPGAWTPPQEDRETYRDIVDFNIFLADRRRLAEKVERERNPQPPTQVVRRDPEPVKADEPPHPDSLWRFTGTGLDAQGIVAFIEHTSTGELTRITGPTDFSLGKITAIGYDALTYIVDDQERVIQVGQSLLGQRVTPPGGATRVTAGSSGAKSGSAGSGNLADRLREMRERRAREQAEAAPEGQATPEGTPAPADAQPNTQPDTQPQPGEAGPAPDANTPSPPERAQPVINDRTSNDR